MRQKIFGKVAQNDLSVGEAIDMFLQSRQAENVRPATLAAYEAKLRIFREWIGADTGLGSVSKDMVEQYKLFLLDGDHGNAQTANSRLRHLRAFIYWCADEGFIPFFKVKLVKAEEPVKGFYSQEELQKLLARPKKGASFSEWRCWALESTLVSTGIRIGSALEIRVEDVTLSPGGGEIVLRHTKSRKRQTVFVSPALSAVLEEYARIRGGDPEEFFFCNVFGEAWTTRSAAGAVQRYNRKRGVHRSSLHDFRRTFATMMAREGVDAFSLQRLLGHSSLEMSRRYVQEAGLDLGRIAVRHDPLTAVAPQKRKALRVPEA